jgi:predicted dithiol-disulfide oxidoreductase (DUF899 family)
LVRTTALTINQFQGPSSNTQGSEASLLSTILLLVPNAGKAGVLPLFPFQKHMANMVDDTNKKTKIHKIVSHDEWVSARKELLEAEKELSKQKAALAQKRRDMPWEEVKEDYEFEMAGSGEGIKLSELCTGEDSTVIIQHFMYKDGDNGCPLCSFFLDSFNGLYPHLKPRVNFCAVALASPEDLDRVGKKQGWSFPLVSARKNTFQKDYDVNWETEDVENGKAVYNYGKEVFKYGTSEFYGVMAIRKHVVNL